MATQQHEFTRLIAVSDLPEGGQTITYDATPEECMVIAKRAEIPTIKAFRIIAELKYLPQSKILHMAAKIIARYEQICVLSLEPFEQNEQFEFASECLDADKIHDYMKQKDGDDELSQDGLEPIINGHLDLGELAVQHFMVMIDPYPKKPGMHLNFTSSDGDPEKIKPFSALKSLKKNV